LFPFFCSLCSFYFVTKREREGERERETEERKESLIYLQFSFTLSVSNPNCPSFSLSSPSTLLLVLAPNVIRFVNNFFDGKLERFLFSSPRPSAEEQEREAPVRLVVLDNYKEEVEEREDERDAFVLFHSETCGTCRKLYSVFAELGKKFDVDDDIVFVKANSWNNDFPEELGLMGVPDLRYYNNKERKKKKKKDDDDDNRDNNKDNNNKEDDDNNNNDNSNNKSNNNNNNNNNNKVILKFSSDDRSVDNMLRWLLENKEINNEKMKKKIEFLRKMKEDL